MHLSGHFFILILQEIHANVGGPSRFQVLMSIYKTNPQEICSGGKKFINILFFYNSLLVSCLPLLTSLFV